MDNGNLFKLRGEKGHDPMKAGSSNISGRITYIFLGCYLINKWNELKEALVETVSIHSFKSKHEK